MGTTRVTSDLPANQVCQAVYKPQRGTSPSSHLRHNVTAGSTQQHRLSMSVPNEGLRCNQAGRKWCELLCLGGIQGCTSFG